MSENKLAFDVENDAYSKYTPEEIIDLMFQNTDKSGMLYVPGFPHYFESGESIIEHNFAVEMKWNESDCDQIKTDYHNLYCALEKIASVKNKLGKTREENASILSKDLLDVWDTYIRDLDTGDLDIDVIYQIIDKKNSEDLANNIGTFLAEIASKDEKITYNGNSKITDEEEKLYSEFITLTHNDAEKRLGKEIVAYNLIICAKRVFHAMSLNAPGCVINKEAKILAQAMVINRFALSIEEI